jgi:hypothetical protein
MPHLDQSKRAQEICTIHDLLTHLKNAKTDFGGKLPVVLDFDITKTIDGASSYRGYYEDLALYPKEYGDALDYRAYPITVDGLIFLLESTIGQTLTGHKGGVFLMVHSTPVWVSNSGEVSNHAVCGVCRPDQRINALYPPDTLVILTRVLE